MKTKQRFGMGVASSHVSKKKTCGKKKHRRSGRSTLLKRNGSDKRTRLHKLAFGSAIRGPIREELIKAGGKKIV
jgi:hypothetical protein